MDSRERCGLVFLGVSSNDDGVSSNDDWLSQLFFSLPNVDTEGDATRRDKLTPVSDPVFRGNECSPLPLQSNEVSRGHPWQSVVWRDVREFAKYISLETDWAVFETPWVSQEFKELGNEACPSVRGFSEPAFASTALQLVSFWAYFCISWWILICSVRSWNKPWGWYSFTYCFSRSFRCLRQHMTRTTMNVIATTMDAVKMATNVTEISFSLGWTWSLPRKAVPPGTFCVANKKDPSRWVGPKFKFL